MSFLYKHETIILSFQIKMPHRKMLSIMREIIPTDFKKEVSPTLYVWEQTKEHAKIQG